MTEHFDPDRDRTAVVSPALDTIQPGWTVFDGLERPVGNVAGIEEGQLRIDGRPEGLGFYNVSAESIARVRDGHVTLNRTLEVPGQPSFSSEQVTPSSPQPGPTNADSGDAAPRARASLWSDSPPEPVQFPERSEQGPRRALLAAPVALGVASGVAYVWWRNRQERRSRAARLRRRLASVSGSVRPVLTSTGPLLDAAREQRRAWWAAALPLIPLAYWLRRSRASSPIDEALPESTPDLTWWSRMPARIQTTAGDVEPPPLWTAAIPVVGAGMAATWFAARRRRRRGRSTQRLSSIMTRDVEAIRPETTVFEAATRMRQLNVGFLPVCDGQRLVGVLTDRDIVIRPLADSRDPQVATAQDAMTRDVIYAHDDDSVDHGARLMRDNQIRRLPIVDKRGSLVGIVSLGDLAVETDRDRLSGSTLERISEPARPRR